jgi:hypothetical protein
MPVMPPPTEVQSDPVAHVDVPENNDVVSQVPKELPSIVKVLSGKGTPEDNLAASSGIQKQANATPYVHENEQMQLPGMIISALKGDLMGVWKYYNGGPVQDEQARGADGKIYKKSYNANGFNGRIKNADGKELSQDEIQALNDKGGVLSGRDAAILKGANYDNLNVIQKAVRDGALTQSQGAYANSLASARSSTAIHNLAQQIINTTESIKNPQALNAIANLSPDQRALLFKYVTDFKTAGQSKGQTSGFGTSANANNNQANSLSVGGSLGGSIPGSVQPLQEGGKGLGVKVDTNVNNTAQNSFGTNASQQAGTTQSQQQGNQAQATIASQVNALTAGAMSPEDFQHFVRLQELNDQLKLANSKVPQDSFAPGYTPAADVDVTMAGRDNILKAMVQHQKNAALNAAFADKVNRDWQEMGRTGQVKDGVTMANEFANSDHAKGIFNSYNEKELQDLSGINRIPVEERAKHIRPKKAGLPYVDITTNKLITQ